MKLLESRLSAFESNREKLLALAEGKFALVHDSTVAGIFDSKADAVREGFSQFGNVPFLVKQIVKIEIPQNFVSNRLAI